MSTHYSINIAFDLKKNLSGSEVALLSFLINKNLPPPTSLPTHSYFENRKNSECLQDNFGTPLRHGCIFNFWNEKVFDERFYGLNLSVKNIKSPQNWELLEFVDWLTSMSAGNSLIGTVANDSTPQEIKILFSINRKLYINNFLEGYATSLIDGDEILLRNTEIQ